MDTARYADLFLTESREHLSAINHALLSLEQGGGAEPLDGLFRAVHTVKGMSATMNYAAVAELAHEMETLLEGLRRGAQPVTGRVMDALFTAADALEAAVEQAVRGDDGAAPDIAAILAELRASAEPEPAGTHVTVRLAADTPLRGVRAFLIVQKARSLGDVALVSPPLEALQAGEFDREFSFRLRTEAPPAEIDRVLRSAGDIDGLEIGDRDRATPIALPAIVPGVPTVLAHGDRPATPRATPAVRPQRHVRIDLRRLDALMNLIGELVIARGRLAQLSGALDEPALEETVAQASRLISDLQDQIMTSRLVPVWQVFDRFPRLVRDAARALAKEIELAVDGKEIELDRSMLDEIGDPVVHLLRNAIDHGIEPPDVREAAGKPRAGRLTINTRRDRSAVVISVSDDGRGIDRGKVLSRAREQGLIDAGRSELSDEELIRLISRPGFSTAERVTDISGRGVGIDAVQERVRSLGGSVEIRTAIGKGTSVTIRLPLTLAIVRALLARVGHETYAIPVTHVEETVELLPQSIRTVRGQEVLLLRDEVLPLLRLRAAVDLPPSPDPAAGQVVIIEVADRRAGLVVDELTEQQEVVVKQFDSVRDGLPIFSGATILGDGAPALIVDVASLL